MKKYFIKGTDFELEGAEYSPSYHTYKYGGGIHGHAHSIPFNWVEEREIQRPEPGIGSVEIDVNTAVWRRGVKGWQSVGYSSSTEFMPPNFLTWAELQEHVGPTRPMREVEE